jgi:DNA (cytosine-5)-methyltransferase 1
MYLSRIKIKESMDHMNIKTYTELADHLGISKNQLSLMLSENYNPLKSRIEELCKVLQVPPNEILDFDTKTEKAIPVTDSDVTNIELFAGAGGLALGLEKAGLKTVEHVEFDKACCETLHANRPDWNVVCNDIHKVDFSQYRDKIDIVTGGFPCQAFSYAGKKLGFDDTRGTLFHEYARCIKEVHPKMFMAENVRGLASHDKGRTLKTIITVLEALGYHTQQQILNAAYYGVGQKRERLVIIGIRNDLDLQFTYPKPEKEMTTLRTALKDCPASNGTEYSERKKKVLAMVPPGGCWVDLPEDVAKSYMGKSYYSGGGRRGMARRISWDEPCLTLTCSPSQKQTERCHPEETRPFTVREEARIQSFPDDWVFCGGIGDQYKQIGNAVPVEMARRIGVQLVKAIRSEKS